MKNSRLKAIPEHDAANHQLVLRVLQSAHAPMTAYEILHALRGNGFNAPLTVYRALKRLMNSGDVHRLESINAYLSCSNHKHHMVQWLLRYAESAATSTNSLEVR